MKLWDVIKIAGSGIISAVVPGGGAVITAINAMLPDDAKLPENATGEQAQDAIARIPAVDRAALMDKQFDVDITQIKEAHSTVRVMLESDTKNPHTTRPYIARHSFHVVGITIIVTITLWSYGIIKADTVMVETIVNGWPFLLAAVTPLVVLLHAYFGILKTEHRQRLDAAGGTSSPTGIGALISAIVNKK